MSDLLLHVGPKTAEFSAAAPENEWGPLQWAPDDVLPDASCFMKRAGPLVEGEIAVGNVSIVPGKERGAKPLRQARIVAVPGPGWGIVWDLDRPWPTGFPIGREAWRRFCLFPSDRADLKPAAEQRARGVFRPDWENRRLVYGPTNMPLPRLSKLQANNLQSIDAQRLAAVRNGLANRAPFQVDDSEDGVFAYPLDHSPHGPPDPGAPGGSGIYFATGWRQNPNDLQIAVLLAPCEHVRMLRYYRRDTGAVLTVDDYPQDPWSPDLWGGPLPETVGVSNADPLPPPYDYAHEIRGSRRTIQITEQLDSPMARRSLAGVAAVARMRFSERGRPPVPGYTPVNVTWFLQQARAAPHTGIWGNTAGRQIGWAAFEIAQDIKVNGGTAGQRRWASDFLDFIEVAESPAGVFQKAWGAPFPEKVDAAGNRIYSMQTFEYVILAYGACGLAIQTGTKRGTGAFLVGLGEIYGAKTRVPILRYYGGFGPWKFLWTTDGKGMLEHLSDGVGASPEVQGDATHAEAGIALAHHLSGDAGWLDRLRFYNGPTKTWKAKLAALTEMQATNIDWQAFAVGQMQKK